MTTFKSLINPVNDSEILTTHFMKTLKLNQKYNITMSDLDKQRRGSSFRGTLNNSIEHDE